VLPSFTLSGVLPPYLPELGATKDNVAGRSPYQITPHELVSTFATSPERKLLLRDLFQYRRSLRQLGIRGYQWIDGSFVEDVEMQRGRPPGDIDVVTFLSRPAGASDKAAWEEFVEQNIAVLTAEGLGLHCFFVDLTIPVSVVIRQSVFWFGLFSHQRETALWKGLVQVSLDEDDASAAALLEGEANAN
jgi:hypothetical protein